MQNSKFKFIDLFCGIGGFHQAMTPLGGECVFACDINELCREVYKQNFCPNEEFEIYGDINKAIKDEVIPKFDVLCGGFPCQTFSKAGYQNGFNVVEKENGEKDERGQLFYRIIDILNEHKECKYVILENVRNLADKKDNWEIICSELKKQGFIITEDPIIESPHRFGVPQVRERVFILGIREEARDNRKKLKKGYLTREDLKIDEKISPCKHDGNCLDDILDSDVDEKYYVPDEIEDVINSWEEFRANIEGLASPFWIHKAGIGIETREEYENDQEIGYKDMKEWKKRLVMKSRVMYENNREFIDDWLVRNNMLERILLHQKFEWNCGTDCSSIRDGIIQIRQSGVRVKRPNYFPSLVAMDNTPIVWDKKAMRYRYITPKESSKLQSFKSDYIFGESDKVSYRQLGKGELTMSGNIAMDYYVPDNETWSVSLDGRYMTAVQNYLEADGIPSEGVAKIVENAARTLSYYPNPDLDTECKKTGLVIGKVQSGKTSNFISITALAFDNGYNVVVVLGGTKKPLVKQNRERIREYFSTTKDVVVLDTTDFKAELTAKKITRFIKIGKKVIIVALKSPNQINYIAENVFDDEMLSEKPTLIIDDEGDERSIGKYAF